MIATPVLSYLLRFEIGSKCEVPQLRNDASSNDFLLDMFTHLLIDLKGSHL